MGVLRIITEQIRSRLAQSAPQPAPDTSTPSVPGCNVAMFHTGRCGSTVIARMLDQHPHVCWAGELFEKLPERYKDILDDPNFVQRVIDDSSGRCHAQHKSIFGFETKYLPHQHFRKQYLDTTLEEYLSLLRSLRAWKFIVLRRDNYLRRAISAEVGRHTHKFHRKQDATTPTRITLDLDGFRTADCREPLLEHFRTIDENYGKLTALLAGDEVLHLSYEQDILNDPMQAYGKVCDFVGVARQSPPIELARTNPFSYEEMVDNFEEVRTLLKGTKYEWMLSC